jgi:hypothetical protein
MGSYMIIAQKGTDYGFFLDFTKELGNMAGKLGSSRPSIRSK